MKDTIDFPLAHPRLWEIDSILPGSYIPSYSRPGPTGPKKLFLNAT